jgi:SAM-dependent methyltransferase
MPLTTDLIDIAALCPDERVLDVACGTGVVARLAAERVGATGNIAGLDPNPGMLAVARSVAPPDMAIDWHQASAEAMPLPDKGAALREMRRVLARGGRLIVNVPGPTPPLFAIMDEALARHIGQEAARFVRMVFSLHDPAELENLISGAGAGFKEVAVRRETRRLRLPAPQEFLWQYVQSTPLAQADDEMRATLEREVVAKWQQFVEDGALMLEVGGIVASARR